VDPGSSSQAKNVIQAIAIAMVVKGALTVITFGIKLPAGIFIPSLGVGACAGRIMGILVQYNRYHHPDSRFFAACGGDLNCVIPGLYAMVGAAATLSGVTVCWVS
jgi:chloride channel 3/4/5